MTTSKAPVPQSEPPVCRCGGEMSQNPDPKAGDPSLEFGYVWQCIPCLLKSRKGWSARALEAEKALAAVPQSEPLPNDDFVRRALNALLELLEVVEARTCGGAFTPNAEASRRIENARAVLAPQSEPALREAIGELFHIGAAVRDDGVIFENARNALRRSDCLAAIEREFFTNTVKDEDGEDYEESLLNWGASPKEYVEQFRAALAAVPQSEPLRSRPVGLIEDAIDELRHAEYKSGMHRDEPKAQYAEQCAQGLRDAINRAVAAQDAGEQS